MAANANDGWGADWNQPTTGGGDWGANDASVTGADASSSGEQFQEDQGHASHEANQFDGEAADGMGGNDKCFGCGESGHRRAECPTAEQRNCFTCGQPGHMAKDCPDKDSIPCENCGETGHRKRECEAPRKINRDHVADVSPEVAWAKLEQAARERDSDDVKEAIQEYVKALKGEPTYRALQEAFINNKVNIWLIAVERSILPTFTNMDLQGNIEKKYTVSYRFSDKPERPREIEGWPETPEEILSRLDDAGEVVNNGKSLCHNCKQVGHVAKNCPEEKNENLDAPRVTCSNCNEDGHRIRDCPQPRVDKFACKNCGQSGHKVAECPEPPNPANMECRKCHETGHMAKDCPNSGGRACHNCGQEGHISRDCDQPVNMDNVQCKNCDQMGHRWKDCPQPKDWSKVQCSQCQEYGHTKARCKALPVEENEPEVADAGYADGQNEADHWGGGDADGAAVSSGGW